MIEVDGATQKSGQAVRGVRLALGGIRKGPVGMRLPFESGQNERNGFIEFAQNLGFGRLAGLGELKVAVAKVAGIGNARTDVVTEIAGQWSTRWPTLLPWEKGLRQNWPSDRGSTHLWRSVARSRNSCARELESASLSRSIAYPLRAELSLMRGGGLFVLVNHALFHYEEDVLGLTNVS